MNGRKFTLCMLFASVLLTLTLVPIFGQQGGGTYDPWIDTNDDGAIDVYDLRALASIYGSSGEPINKTDILLELQSRVDDLESTLVHNRTEIRIVIWTNATLERISFNGMSITDVYAYNITFGRTVLRYDGGLCIMMNQIFLAPATWAYPHLNIEIPLRVLISNKTITMEAYNGGGAEEPITTITFYNAQGMLVASFTNRRGPSPYDTETFHIDSDVFFS